VKMSSTPPALCIPPPALGQHTNTILGEDLGLTDTEIAALRRDGAIS
jgi:crotonobetainyl-CoA:carnitine CoA-transferase CaiB-like acyl-CoA transferase